MELAISILIENPPSLQSVPLVTADVFDFGEHRCRHSCCRRILDWKHNSPHEVTFAVSTS